MTFTNFLQVLAFNLLSNTIPLCILLYVTSWLIIKLYEKRILELLYKKAEDAFRGGIRQPKNQSNKHTED